MPITEPIDEDELETELAALEQEKLDEDMLKTGTMPVMSPLNGLPNGPTGDSKCFSPPFSFPFIYLWFFFYRLHQLPSSPLQPIHFSIYLSLGERGVGKESR